MHSAAPPNAGAVAMPQGFLEDFAARHETEGLDAVLAPIGAWLGGEGVGAGLWGGTSVEKVR